MVSRRIIAILLILSLVIVPMLPLSQSQAASGTSNYSEKVNVYVSGSNAYWQMRLSGVNASNPYLTDVEALQGLSWYNVTAIKTSSWLGDFQAFGPQGYNVIPVPYLPPQGLFLSVGATSYGTAAQAVGYFDHYLTTTFTSYSNSSATGVYTFTSSISFNELVPRTLYKFVPTITGFASVVNGTGFDNLQGPMITLEGDSGSSGFTHIITLADVTSSGLNNAGNPTILNYFGSAGKVLTASNISTSSVVDFHVLDGILSPGNATGVSNDRQHFTSSYVINMNHGQKIRSINETILEQPVELLSTRQIDNGVLRANSTVTVTLTIKDLSNSTSVDAVNLNDNWWQSYPFLKLVSGNSTVSDKVLSAGTQITPTYVLEDTGNAVQQISIPGATVSYHYAWGGQNDTFYSQVNGASLSVGTDEPVVYAYLKVGSGFGKAVGNDQNLTVVIKNVGTRAASDVMVNGAPVSGVSTGLTADGGQISLPYAISAPSLADVNVTATYLVQYTSGGAQESANTNSLSFVFAHTNMNIGFGQLAVNSTIAAFTKGVGTNLTLTFTSSNYGALNMSFIATGRLPAGLACGTIKGTGLTCSNGVLNIQYKALVKQVGEISTMGFNVTTPESYYFPSLNFSGAASGYTLLGQSNIEPAPTGLVFTKTFTPSQLFGGMASSVAVSATNKGPFPVFNATIATTSDGFDTIPVGAAPTTATNKTIAPGTSLSFTYTVTTDSTPGTQTATPVSSTFYFGGQKYAVTRTDTKVVIFHSVSASVTTTPATPEEGKDFKVTISITNPSAVNVTNVQFVIPIPSGVTISSATGATVANGKLTVSTAALAAGKTYTVNLTASAGSGVSIPFTTSKLTFSYEGTSVNGAAPISSGIAINENVTIRYVIPIALAVLVMLAVVILLRTKTAPTAPASQQ